MIINRVIIPATVVVFMGLAGCTPHENHDQRNPKNEALVIKYFDAALKPDFETLEEFLSDEYKLFGPAVKDSVDRATFLASWRKSWDEEFSSMTYDRYGTLSTTVEEGRVAGDWVLDWGKWTIHYKNGKPPFTVWFHAALRVKNGKINRQRNFYDVSDILQQQGFKFVPPVSGAEEMKK